MGAPINNKNGLGNSGGKKARSGRKSVFQEMATAERLNEIFFKKFNIDQLKAKINSSSYSVNDLFILKGLEGDVRVMTSVFNRIFPDKINLHTNSNYGRKSYDPTEDAEIDRLIKVFSDNENKNI